MDLYFLDRNHKLYRMTACKNYKGKLFGKIKTGMSREKFTAAEPTFKLNKEYNMLESKTKKGAAVGFFEYPYDKITCIEVYIKEDWYGGKW